MFPDCADANIDQLKLCFNNTLQEFVYNNFEVPDIVTTENYKGAVAVFFEIDKEGKFRVIMVDAVYDQLKQEARRVFEMLPQIQPATYNGEPTYVQFTLAIKIPKVAPVEEEVTSVATTKSPTG